MNNVNPTSSYRENQEEITVAKKPDNNFDLVDVVEVEDPGERGILD